MKITANEYSPQEIIKIIREWTELTQKEFGNQFIVVKEVFNH